MSPDFELRAEVRSAWDLLSPEQRALLHLRHVEELGYAEIARRQEVSVEAVRKRLYRARSVLRRLYEP